MSPSSDGTLFDTIAFLADAMKRAQTKDISGNSAMLNVFYRRYPHSRFSHANAILIEARFADTDAIDQIANARHHPPPTLDKRDVPI